MSKNVVIVESPAKAKTIEKILGKDFKVVSSYGHIRDLSKGDDAIDIENNFEPKYIVTPDKKKVVKQLKKEVKSADEVYLATDEDREGEAISWHLCKVLNLDENQTKRLVFREITSSAIKNALSKPRHLDKNLVNAQQARRLLDRLVGFELSELLWRKVRNKLSAGRVQSVAVKLIVEKEREIINHSPENYYSVKGLFTPEGKKNETFKARLSERLENRNEAYDFLKICEKSDFKVADVTKKPLTRRPTPPFTTSTLQQEASRKLGFSVSRTMRTAQKLYEQGKITYMRTDSTTLSESALKDLKKVIASGYGENYHKQRWYKGKKSAQEAHEAIRPTYAKNSTTKGDRDMQRLYDLIWKRTVASQMADAKLEKTTIVINVSGDSERTFKAVGEVLLFDGFLKVYLEGKDDEDEERDEGLLPALKSGDKLEGVEIEALERHTRPPARYTEASLVKKLEELGIGRPSTYAPTIAKIMDESRGYVMKESREGKETDFTRLTLKKNSIKEDEKTEVVGSTKNRLYSSDIGMVVTDFLDLHFDTIMDYHFTASMEEDFDRIAQGEKEWTGQLKEFYFPFHKQVEKTTEEADRAHGERILGTHPESGKTILVRVGRYGPIVQVGKTEELEEDEKPQYANIPKNRSIETITLEEALKLFALPRMFEPVEEKEVQVNVGRYGPYVKWGDHFISLPKGTDPYEVDEETVDEMIAVKKKELEPIGHYEGVPLTKGKGRYGPYIKWGNLYVNIPRKHDPDDLDPNTALELLKAKIEKENKKYIKVWEDQKLSIQNGRWGPYIKHKRKNYKLPKGKDGKKMTQEEAEKLTLEEVQNIIKEQ